MSYPRQAGSVSIVYASLTLLATPERDLKVAAALLTASDSLGCCHAHSNCTHSLENQILELMETYKKVNG